MLIQAKIIGIYEIIGGVMGGIIIVFNWIEYMGESSSNSLLVVNSLFGFVLFLICAYAGFRLYEGKIAGYNLSIWMQALQIPKLMIGGFAYFFAAGLQLLLGLHEDTSFGFLLSTSKTGFQFGFITDEPVYAFSVNLIALSLCIYLVRLLQLKKVEERLSDLKTCPYCGASLAFDKERFIKESGTFCKNCQNVIRSADLKKKVM